MLNNIDWRFLRRTLIIFGISILLSVAFIMAGYEFEASKIENYNAGKSTLSSTHTKYKKLVEDLDLLTQYTKTYDEYKNIGLLGEERRLSWIETLEAVNEKLKLPKLAYSLAPQESFTAAALKVEKNITVNSTPMSLNMDILHEGDLFNVFNDIEASISNLFTIDSCTISRVSRQGEPLNTKKANLNSNCLLRWITVNVK